MANEQALEYFNAHIRLNKTKVTIDLFLETKTEIYINCVQLSGNVKKGKCG